MANTKSFPVKDYDLDATLSSGQAFRWKQIDRSWLGVIDVHWVRLRASASSITAETGFPVSDWSWLTHYLQLDVDLNEVMLTFPEDEPMRAAVTACRGLRLLRQPFWECLASFILSSTKQIVQIQQIISFLCDRFGEPLVVPSIYPTARAFPSASRLARATETELRSCKMGFRAPYLLETAKAIASGQFDLSRLQSLPVETARDELMKLPGVGRKIADCVLLFAYGFPTAFPVDVWVMKALQGLYFPKRRGEAERRLHLLRTTVWPNGRFRPAEFVSYMRCE